MKYKAKSNHTFEIINVYAKFRITATNFPNFIAMAFGLNKRQI